MKRFSCIMMALMCCSIVFAQTEPDKPVDADISISHTDKNLIMTVQLDIRPGVHVYSAEENFFNIATTKNSNITVETIRKSAVKPYENFDGSIVDVFDGDATIVVGYRYDGTPGQEWNFEGYVQFQGCTDTTCYPPQKVPFSFSGTIPDSVDSLSETATKHVTVDESPYARGLWWGILGAFVAGMLLSLTPCVYPMVGITVAVIGAKNASRKESIILTFLYVLGLSVVYAVVGVIVASVGSAAASFFRSAWVLVPIGIIFILLGLSMFDVFALQTSSALSVKVQSLAGRFKGSYGGTFLLGALSAFVVGPCVSGPLISLITFVATTGNVVHGFAYFFALAWGMGMLLFVAGTAAGALPRAGGWMEKIKHTIGIVLIWAAFYFTRPIVGETVFVTANIVALAVGLNALGVLDIGAASKSRRGFVGLIIGLAVLCCTVYYTVGSLKHGESIQNQSAKVDLERIVAQSEKPIILDFTAPWCTICKEIKETVLDAPHIQTQLEQKFTFVEVDYDANPELVKRFDIIGPPAFVFLDASGMQLGSISVTGEELKERILRFGE